MTKRLVATFICWAMGTFVLPSALVEVDFSITGGKGYSAHGTLAYDTTSAPPTISYSLGSGSGLDSLVISFYDPSSLLLGEFADVLAGDVKYGFFALNFDTASLTFSGVFDFGQDTLMADQYFWGGTVGSSSYLISVPTYVNLDSASATVIQVNAVPEPAGCALVMGLGLLGLVACGRRKPA